MLLSVGGKYRRRFYIQKRKKNKESRKKRKLKTYDEGGMLHTAYDIEIDGNS